jgi:hypothetical protein
LYQFISGDVAFCLEKDFQNLVSFFKAIHMVLFKQFFELLFFQFVYSFHLMCPNEIMRRPLNQKRFPLNNLNARTDGMENNLELLARTRYFIGRAGTASAGFRCRLGRWFRSGAVTHTVVG